MANQWKTFYITIGLHLCSVCFVFPQNNYDTCASKHILETRKSYASRSYDEKKLGSLLYAILRISEEPDTSDLKKRSLELILKSDKNLRADDSGRIVVLVELYGMSSVDRVLSEVRSLNIKVEREYEYVPIIICRTFPKELRKLISINGIKQISQPSPGHTR